LLGAARPHHSFSIGGGLRLTTVLEFESLFSQRRLGVQNQTSGELAATERPVLFVRQNQHRALWDLEVCDQ
jgi:hypothetical protein